MSDIRVTSLDEYEPLLDTLIRDGATYADIKLQVEHSSRVALRAHLQMLRSPTERLE